MTETATYKKASKTSSTGMWVTTGVVVTSMETGQFKALMPVLNSYSDINAEGIKSVDENTFYADEALTSAYSTAAEVTISGVDAPAHDAMLEAKDGGHTKEGIGEGNAMKHGAPIDAHHLSIMIGLASLTGAATNMLANAVTGSNAPQALVITLSATAFFCGRFLSAKLRHLQNG